VNLRVFIADDEAPARARLRQFLKAEPTVSLIGESANGRQALAAIQHHAPDLVFLDIQMPGLDGLEVCRALAGRSRPLIVFVTAYDQYAVQAFEVHAVDYLLKPFDQARLQRALEHARDLLERDQADAVNRRLLAALDQWRSANPPLDRLAFKSEGRVVFVRVGQIDWIEAEGNYARLHVGGATHLLRETMNGLEQQLPPAQFLRISRSAIVNLDRIKEVQPLFYGDQVVLLQNGTRLTLSRNYRDRLEARLVRPK